MRSITQNNFTPISCIICVHNASETIRLPLESLKASSLQCTEIIVVDDASTDDTVRICEEYPVRIIRLEKNMGPAAARNRGIREACSGLLFLLDSDVSFDPSLPLRMLHLLMNTPDAAGVGSISSPEPLNPNFYSRYFAMQEYFGLVRTMGPGGLVRMPFICTRCGFIRRHVFDDIGLFDESFDRPSIEDYELSMRMQGKHDIVYRQDLTHFHCFPSHPFQIWSRYKKNMRAMTGLWLKGRAKSLGPFQDDAMARVLLGMSGLTFILSTHLGLAGILFSLIFFISSIILRRSLLVWFCRLHGPGFAIKGWITYCLSSIPMALGAAHGLWDRFRDRFKTVGDQGVGHS